MPETEEDDPLSQKSHDGKGHVFEEIVIPDIPEQAVRLKVDFRTNKLLLDEENLIQTLTKLRRWIKASNEQMVWNLKDEIENQVKSVRQDVAVSIEEAITDLGIDDSRKQNMLEEQCASHEEEIEALKSEMEFLRKKAGSVASGTVSPKFGAPEFRPDEVEEKNVEIKAPVATRRMSYDGTPSPAKGSVRRSILVRSQTQPMDDVDFGSEGSSSGHATSPLMKESKESSSGESQKKKRSHFARKASEEDFDVEEVGQMARHAEEALQAMQDDMTSNSKMFSLLEQRASSKELQLEKLASTVAALDERLRDAEASRRVMASKAQKHEEGTSRLEAKLKLLDGQTQNLDEHLDSLEKAKASNDDFLGIEMQVSELQDQISQAALAAVIEPKVDGVIVKLERLIKATSKTDEGQEGLGAQFRNLESEMRDNFSVLGDMAHRKEVEKRCEGLEMNMRGLSHLLSEVQGSLGDLSSAILALRTKAERTDLNVLREEMSRISENLSDKEQTVLFGARCLSCNRVFDDVNKDANSVDLPGEKQRNALFAQVQRALHSPKIDPLAKIKVLAVKVGRPITVPGSSGTNFFGGRDDSAMACGMDDVQLVPIRDSGGKETRPESNRQSAKGRRIKGAPQRETGSSNEVWSGTYGSMDFKQPLSQLVDRCTSSRLLPAL